jgi:hypothetical protein
VHSPDNQVFIFFLSKSWTEMERLKPPFYLEGDALLWATHKCKYYALSSPHPLYTYSDHMPLNWMSKTDKGPISSFSLLKDCLRWRQCTSAYLDGLIPSQIAAAVFLCWGQSG